MANTTANYALPYLELADPPNLATGTQNLATAVDTQLTRIDAKPMILSAAATATQDLTTTEVDITGATLTFTTLKANARFMCTGSFYFASIGVANSGVASGKLFVDNVVQAGFANFTGDSATPDRMNLSQTWIGTLAAAGSHTLKLRAVGSAAVAAQRTNATSTTLTVMVFEAS
jgi:hypothetical protein